MSFSFCNNYDFLQYFFKGDRYNRESNNPSSPRSRADDWNQPSKLQQIKDTIDNIRPGGKRDYSNYNVRTSTRYLFVYYFCTVNSFSLS